MWEKRLEVLIDEPDYESLMIDASPCKVRPLRPEPKAPLRTCAAPNGA